MMTPLNADLMKHPTASHCAPTNHEREVVRAQRKARRAAFWSFVDAVFSHSPRHPDPVGHPRRGQGTAVEA